MPSFHWTTLKHMYMVITNDYQTHCNSLYTYHAILIYYPPKKKKKKRERGKKTRERYPVRSVWIAHSKEINQYNR